MSFFNKVMTSIKGAANDTLDAHQNLGATARQNVRDLEDNLIKAESALVDVRAEAEILNGKKTAAEAEVAKWLKAATSAAGKDDNLARECLAKKATAAATLKTITDELAKFQPTVDGISKHIADLRTQKERLSSQADIIGVRSDVADVELKAASILTNLGGTGVSFEDTENALAKKEAKAHAATSVIADRTGTSLEARVAALDTGTSIEDELAALKASK